MVNISRYFLASAQELCSHCTNRNVVYEAMKCVVKKSLEYKHAIYVKNLYGSLKKNGIDTTRRTEPKTLSNITKTQVKNTCENCNTMEATRYIQ